MRAARRPGGRAVGLVLLFMLGGCSRPQAVPAGDTTVHTAPSDAVAGATAIGATSLTDTVLGVSLGDWRAKHPGDSVLSIDIASGFEFDEWRDIPVIQPLCGRATEQLGKQGGLSVQRRVLFELLPPKTGLPDPSLARTMVRDRYCLAVLAGYDAIAEGRTRSMDPVDSPFLDSLLAKDREGLRPLSTFTIKGGPVPRDALGVTRDGAVLGYFSNQVYSEQHVSCFEGLTSEISGPGSACAALYRWDPRGIAGLPFGPPTAPPRNVLVEAWPYLRDTVRGLDSLTTATLDMLDLGRPAGRADALDSTVFRVLRDLKSSASRMHGDDAALRFVLLDLAIERAVDAGFLGVSEDGEGDGTVARTVKDLGADYAYDELGGTWGNRHTFFRRAESEAISPAIQDSLYTWFRQGQSACTLENGYDFAERIEGQRRYLTRSRSTENREEALVAEAQLWSDSLRRARGGTVNTVLDSTRTALRRALEVVADTVLTAKLHTAIWRAAAGLPPLPRRDYCEVSD